METLVQRINKTSVQCLIIHESIFLTSSVQSKRKETQEQAKKKKKKSGMWVIETVPSALSFALPQQIVEVWRCLAGAAGCQSWR